jgi:hypothetical protein
MGTEAWLFRLEHAKTNTERWHMFFNTQSVQQREDALYAILTHATENRERWSVFQHTFHTILQERALYAILFDAIMRGDLEDMWAVYNCSSPNLAALAYAFIHLIDFVHPDMYVEVIEMGAEEQLEGTENVREEYALLEKSWRLHT